MKKNIIRIGDRVKVIQPDLFIRCGYPYTKEHMLRNVLKPEDVIKIEKFLADFGVHQDYFHIKDTNIMHPIVDKAYYTRAFDKVADGIAYGLLHAKGFGGRERKVYTEREEKYLNATGTVMSRKVVNSGHYVPGYNGSWLDPYDSEPAYLTNQKTHVIFEVELDYNPDQQCWYPFTVVQIEKTNLEKIV